MVEHVLETELGLKLSLEKTKVTTYGKGYDFLRFTLSSHSRRMRAKSKQKFKDKIRELTIRKHNLDSQVIKKLNAVIRGTANYFGKEFSTNRRTFQKLDSWIRMRLRAMKFKRKCTDDNKKLRVDHFTYKLRLQSLEGLCLVRDAHGNIHRATPRYGATPIGVAR